jgi:PQQ-like domain
MTTADPARTARRRVLAAALAALASGIAAVALIQIDKHVAHQGNELPQVALRTTRWLALAFGLTAVALWFWERRRSHLRVTAGLVVALVTVLATPVATAVALPDNTPATVVAFDASSGRKRWQHDVALFYSGLPMQLDGRNQLVLNGVAATGRCNTRPERFVLDPANGRTVSRTRNASLPFRASPAVPRAAGEIQLRIVDPPPTPESDAAVNGERTTQPGRTAGPSDIYPRLQAHDKAGRVLWSALVDRDYGPPIIYADAAVVVIYPPRGQGIVGIPGTTGLAKGSALPVYVLDAHTGRVRWATETNIDAAPRFSRTRTFALEGFDLVVRVTDTGKIVARHALTPPVEEFPDARLERSEPRGEIALVEGTARKLTLFDPSGRVRWTATLPRSMRGSEVAAFGDTVYVRGGGTLGYVCGGE